MNPLTSSFASLLARTAARFDRGLLGACVAVCTVAACSNDDTLLALNVHSSKGEVGSVSTVEVTVTQQGNAPFNTRFAPPLIASGDGGMMVPDRFYQRIALPDGFDKAPADVSVSATNTRGMAYSGTTKVTIQPEEAVVATVMLALPMADAGAGNGGADAGDAGDAGHREAVVDASPGAAADGSAREAAADPQVDSGADVLRGDSGADAGDAGVDAGL